MPQFNPGFWRERMGFPPFADPIHAIEGFHETALAPLNPEPILSREAKADTLVGLHEHAVTRGATEQKNTLGGQITTLDKTAPSGVLGRAAPSGPAHLSASQACSPIGPVHLEEAEELDFQAFVAQLEAEQDVEQAAPKPRLSRAPSTKNRAQLKTADERRAFHQAERESREGPMAWSGELAAQVAGDLSSRRSSPVSEEDRAQEARFNQHSLFLEPKLVAELDAPFHWWRAVKLLEPIQGVLGTAYRPLLVILSLASSVGRSLEDLERLGQSLGGTAPDSSEPRRDSVFFAALWEVATVTGITPDYLRKVLARHSGKLRRILHHHDWKTETTFTGEKQVLIAGCLFRVRWPSSGESYTPTMLRGGKTKTVYKALINRKAVYRDLDADVYDGHTEQKYRSEGKVSSNPLGRVKNVTSSDALPEGFALELLTYCMGRIRGLTGSNVSDIQRYGNEIERINALVSLLETPLERGHNKLENRVRAVASLLCQTLEHGSERSYRGWLEVGWTLYRTGKVAWLLQAVWDVLIRASDLGSIRSKGALVRHLLNARGYAELRSSFEVEQAA